MKIREISRYVVRTRLKLKREKLTHQLNNTQFIYVCTLHDVTTEPLDVLCVIHGS